MDAANGILSREGYLVLDEEPELWIQRNPSHLLSVRRLKLDYSRLGGSRKIGDSIGEFKELTHLSFLDDNGILTHLPDNLPSLRKLKVLHLYRCYKLRELPPNLGDLYTLTSLSLCVCKSIKSLPGSLGKLSNLTDLFISDCYNLEELPADFGELESLTHFTLQYCRSIKFLPSSVAELPKLTTLTIRDCYALQKLPDKMGELKSLTHVFIRNCRSLRDCPSSMNLVDLNIRDCCSIQSLPRGLSNLKHLYLPLCINREEERFANLKYCVSLRLLKFWDCSSHKPKEFPLNVDKLPQLSLLDIQDTRIKWLPSSISKLSKLRLLLLPYGFLLDTLPYDLDESLVISVKRTHVRKTWKEFKTELEIFSCHTVGVDPSGYLSLTGDPAPWIQNNSTSLSRVRILDLDLRGNRAGNIKDSIADLAELTHLVISGGSLRQLPQTFTRISHISLHACKIQCNMKSGFDNLGKLSTLKSLDLFFLFDTRLPAHVDLPVSLRRLSLGRGHINFIPLLNSTTKLSNLKALHLFRFEQFDFLPKNLNVEKLELVDCCMTNIKSLPRGLRHLEILHSKEMCISECDKLGSWFNQLVDVETLSVTCHRIKFLPSVAGLHNVRELQLKDCFSIKQLPPNLDVMVNLCTLNLSGTRIKSLPHSILKLPKLQCLILPKCFQPGSLPLEIRNQPLVSFDNTDDRYYEDMGYYDSYRETFDDEADDNTTNTIESEEGSTSQQNISSHQLLDQPDATPVFKDYNFDGRDSNHINTNRHSCNQEMPENMICLNEGLKESEKRITAEQQSSPKQLLSLPDSIRGSNVSVETDSNSIGSSDLIGKNNHCAISPLQNQEREPISSGDCDKMITYDNSSCNKTDVSHSGNSFTLEDFGSLDKGMTLSDAGQELDVSEPRLKRRCRELGIKELPSSRHHDTNMREVSSSRSSSTSGSNFGVKACNEENGEIVRFVVSLSSNIDKLKYEIGKRLELEVGKFKIKYEDNDGDWVSVTCITDLKHALSLSKADYVRLSVFPKT